VPAEEQQLNFKAKLAAFRQAEAAKAAPSAARRPSLDVKTPPPPPPLTTPPPPPAPVVEPAPVPVRPLFVQCPFISKWISNRNWTRLMPIDAVSRSIFNLLYHILSVMDRVFIGLMQFYRVLTEFYWVSLGCPGFYWVLLGFTRFYWVLLGFTRFSLQRNEFCHIEHGLTGFYWVSLGFTRFYWVLLGFTGFH